MFRCRASLWLGIALLAAAPTSGAPQERDAERATAASLIGRHAPALRRLAEAPDPKKPGAGELSSLRFEPSAKPRVAAALARTLAPDSTTRKQLAKAFPEMLAAFRDLVKQGGEEPHDLAVAYAYFIAANWSVASGGKEVSDAASEALLAQVRSVLGGSELEKADGASKEELWETLVILSSFAAGGYGRGAEENDAGTMAAMRTMAAENLKVALGLAADAISITERGLSVRAARLSVKLPAGWSKAEQDGAQVLTPGDVGADRVYAVILSQLKDGQETLTQILASGKRELAPDGGFQSAGAAKTGTSQGGWEYRWVAGSFERSGKAAHGVVAVLRREGQTGLALVVADSEETIQKYSAPFAEILASASSSVAEPVPAEAPPASAGPPEIAAPASPGQGEGDFDLVYTTPPGWTEERAADHILLHRSEQVQPGTDFYGVRDYRLIILKSSAAGENLSATFHALWKSWILSLFETDLSPLPIRRRLKSGLACAMDGTIMKNRSNGGQVECILYVLEAKDRVVPVIGIYNGNDEKLEKSLSELFHTATIRGRKPARRSLYSAEDLVGRWSTSSTSLANYVDAAGRYAGDASISTGETYEFRADGTFESHFAAVRASGRPIQAHDSGKWAIDDDRLVLEIAANKDSEAKTQRLLIYGVGQPPKGAGPALYLPPSYNGDAAPEFSVPRRPLSAEWYGKVVKKD